MFKTRMKEQYSDLPEPIALTAEQIKEVAAKTAGGAAYSVLSAGIINGGRAALTAFTSPAVNVANVQQEMAF